MALALFAGAAASLGVLVSDLARVRVDPRLAPNVFARSRRA
jgi:hypothetical protein